MFTQDSNRRSVSASSPISALAHQHLDVIDVLEQEIALWLPSISKNGEPIDHPQLTAIVQKKFLTLFGGCTAVRGYGSTSLLQSTQAEPIEPITFVTSFTTAETLSEKWPALCELVELVLRSYQQATVLLKINHQAIIFSDQKNQDVNHAA